MAKRKLYILIGTISLFFGGLTYIFFRDNTYISNSFDSQLVENIRCALINLNFDFVEFYLPDLLWALSLCCYLLALFNPKQIGAVFCTLIGLFYGVLWEVGQYIGAINGTGDIVDIIMYLIASIFALLISKKEKTK